MVAESCFNKKKKLEMDDHMTYTYYIKIIDSCRKVHMILGY